MTKKSSTASEGCVPAQRPSLGSLLAGTGSRQGLPSALGTSRLLARGHAQPFENVFYQRPKAMQRLPVTTERIWFGFSDLSLDPCHKGLVLCQPVVSPLETDGMG